MLSHSARVARGAVHAAIQRHLSGGQPVRIHRGAGRVRGNRTDGALEFDQRPPCRVRTAAAAPHAGAREAVAAIGVQPGENVEHLRASVDLGCGRLRTAAPIDVPVEHRVGGRTGIGRARGGARAEVARTGHGQLHGQALAGDAIQQRPRVARPPAERAELVPRGRELARTGPGVEVVVRGPHRFRLGAPLGGQPQQTKSQQSIHRHSMHRRPTLERETHEFGTL